LQQVLADNPAIEVANDVPPFKFTKAGLDQFATDSLLEGTGFEPSVPDKVPGVAVVSVLV
jgi:hypothetical protein